MTTETKPQPANGLKNQDIRAIIKSDWAKGQFAMALPKHLTPERFMRVALTALTKTPKLVNCTKESLMTCLLDCSSLGIEPDGRKAHLIPYGNVCTLIIDYKGLVDLARRSGDVAYIHADVVREKDEFDYAYGSNAFLKHKPAADKRGSVTQVYSFVKLKDGSESFIVMSVTEIEAVRKRSKAANNGPWCSDWDEMAKKTAFRRHSKWLPLSSEFQEANEKDFDTLPDTNSKPDDLAIDPEMPQEIKADTPAAENPPVVEDGPIESGHVKTIKKLMEAVKLQDGDLLDFLTDFGVQKVEDLKFSQFKEVTQKLMNMADKNDPKKTTRKQSAAV